MEETNMPEQPMHVVEPERRRQTHTIHSFTANAIIPYDDSLESRGPLCKSRIECTLIDDVDFPLDGLASTIS